VEQVHHRWRPHGRIVEDPCHVEADDAFGKVRSVIGIVEQPSPLPRPPPGAIDETLARGKATTIAIPAPVKAVGIAIGG